MIMGRKPNRVIEGLNLEDYQREIAIMLDTTLEEEKSLKEINFRPSRTLYFLLKKLRGF